MKKSLLLLMLLFEAIAHAQVVNICTNPAAQAVLLGRYNPYDYHATYIIEDPTVISRGINSLVSPDSLHAYLDQLRTFGTRNTASDTLSSVRGIGAARRWAYNKFSQFSADDQHRLLVSYMQFDTTICGVPQHRNIFAVLPGMDTSDKSVVIIEGHIDSRCMDVCDTTCIAQGIDDNGSGTALVLELARVMSRYSFRNTIVFALVTGEEQGLYGGQAFASFAQANGVKVKAVLNNDITGGVFCGHTSSAPSCPGFGDIDSTHLRLFSYGGFNSPHKGLARYIKLEYKEMIQPIASVPMGINIMTPEDRTGRGGDHIPFRQLGYTAMRFTSANEDGDADVTSPSYIDRQHTSRDSIGVDVNNDGIIDTYYVDMDYLARNTVINGNAAAMMARGVQTPDLTLATTGGNLIVTITAHPEYMHYRVGLRTTTYDWDSVYTFNGLTDTITLAAGNYVASVAAMDTSGIESLFSEEVMKTVTAEGVAEVSENTGIELLQNQPNPADEATMVTVVVHGQVAYKQAFISIVDMSGREVGHLPVTLAPGVNEVMYSHGYHATGTYIYTLVADGRPLSSRRMVFTE
jgi:Peptidase family M28